MSSRTRRIRKQRKREQKRIVGNCCNCEKQVKKEDAFPEFHTIIWERVSCLDCILLFISSLKMIHLIKGLNNGD